MAAPFTELFVLTMSIDNIWRYLVINLSLPSNQLPTRHQYLQIFYVPRTFFQRIKKQNQ